MGIRDKLKKRMGRVLNQFSGEYSAPAKEEYTEPYEVPGGPQEDAEVTMARLNRPTGGPKKK